MISAPRTKIDDEVEVLEQDEMTSDYGWIFKFVLTQQSCAPKHRFKVCQFEIYISERVDERNFTPIVFQLGGKTYGDIESLAQNLFYDFTTMLSYDLEAYALEGDFHVERLRKYIDATLSRMHSDEAYNPGIFSHPIMKVEPPSLQNIFYTFRRPHGR